MKKLVYLFYLFILKDNCRAQNTLAIYYNTTDCANCNIFMHKTKSISPSVEKKFYTLQENEAIIEEIFKNLDLSTKEFKINYLPNNYFVRKNINNQQTLIQSYCIFYEGITKKDSFLLKELSTRQSLISNDSNNSTQKHSNINTLTNNTIENTADQFNSSKLTSYSIILPDSIKLSSQIKVFIKGNLVNILDLLLNKNITIFLDENGISVNEIKVVKGQNFNPGSFLFLNCFDTSLYKACYPMLVKYKRQTPMLQSAFLNDTSVSIIINFPYARILKANTRDSILLKKKKNGVGPSVNDTMIGMKSFIYTNKFKIKQSSLACITEPCSQDLKNCLSSQQPFYFKDSVLFASVFNNSSQNSADMLCEYAKKGSTYEFKKIFKNSSKDSIFNQLGSNFIMNREINSEFYFTTSTLYAMEYKTNKSFNIPLNELVTNSNIFILDVLKSGKQLQFIIKEENAYFIYYYDFKTKRRISKKPLELDLSLQNSIVKFLNNNKILLINGNKLNVFNFQ